MATKETRADRGRRRGTQLTARTLDELRTARIASDVSQRTLAEMVGWSHSEYWRFESGRAKAISIGDVSTVASVLGLELSVSLHPVGEPLRDKGHQALIARLRAILSPAFRVLAEAPLPNVGDRRAWDLLLRLPAQLIGVEAETRIRDMQRLVRHMHERERDGGTDATLLLLSDTRTNRELLPELIEALGPAFARPPRELLGSLRAGRPLQGSGVVLL